MEERGDRRRAFHRVRKPHMQRHLGRLADRPAKDQHAGHGEVNRVRREDGADVRRELAEHQRAGRPPQEKDAEKEPEVADAVDDERLLARVRGGVLFEIVPDEDVGAEPDQLPEDEHHHEIVGEHDAEHRKEEQGQPRKIPPVALLGLHVADRIGEDEGRDCRHHDKHHLAEMVNRHPDRNPQGVTDFDPRKLQRDRRVGLEKHPPAQHAPGRGRPDRQPGAQRLGMPPDKQDHRRSSQRGEKNDPGRGERAH